MLNSAIMLHVFKPNFEAIASTEGSEKEKDLEVQREMLVFEISVFEDITDTVVVFICYKLFFSLKRVEIQINPNYKSVDIIIKALKK